MPCAACKLLRRPCTADCIFLPHFPPTRPEKFVAVHRIFGASNISKMLRVTSSTSSSYHFPFTQEIPTTDREDAVTSMVYEDKARVADPVYGCVGFIASLQTQVFYLQSELNTALAETMALKARLSEARATSASLHNSPSIDPRHINQHQFGGHNSHPDPSDAMLLSSPVMDYIHIDEFASNGIVKAAFPTFGTE